MKLSVELIARELSLSFPGLSVRTNGVREEEMAFHNYALLEGAPYREAGFLYLTGTPGEISPDLARELADAGCGLIVTGKAPEDAGTLPVPAVVCASSDSAEAPAVRELYRAVSGIFARFDAWLDTIYAATGPDDIQRILEASLPVFHRPLHFFEDRLVQDTASAGELSPTESGGKAIDYKVMSQRFNEPFSKESMHYKGAFIYPKGALNEDLLCYNIFTNKFFSARLYCSIGDVLGDYLASDYALITILGRLLQLIYQESGEEVYEANQDIIPFLQDLVLGKQVSKIVFQYALHNRGWVGGKYSLIYLCANRSGNLYERNCNYLCHILSERYDNIVPFPYEDNIIIVHYETASRHISEFIPILDDLVAMSHLQYGISNQSADPNALPYLLLQAKAACFHSDVDINAPGGYRFDDIACEYLVTKGTAGCPLDLMIAQEILALREYDAANSSDYAETLKTYLYCGLNAAEAAKALFIHYATMVYRLKRIEEIARVDFGNFDRVVFLYLSFRMLDRQE